MASATITVRTDNTVKEEADELFADLGINMSTAINMFLRQAVREQKIPFEITRNVPNAETIAAIREGKALLQDPAAPRYSSIEDLKAALDS